LSDSHLPDAPPLAPCVFGARGARVDALLWGDSHADAFAPGVAAWAAAEGLTARQITKAGCPPLLGVLVVQDDGRRLEECRTFNAGVLKLIRESPGLRYLVLDARWARYAETTPISDSDGGPVYLTDAARRGLDAATSRAVLADALPDTVAAALAAGPPGMRILIVGPIPEFTHDVTRCLARARMARRAEAACGRIDANAVARRERDARAIIEAAARIPRVSAAFPASALCGERECRAVIDGRALYRDDNHLSAAAARELALRLLPRAGFRTG
jgi:hypothetical protein